MNCCREDEWSGTTRSRAKEKESKRTNAEQIEKRNQAVSNKTRKSNRQADEPTDVNLTFERRRYTTAIPHLR